jgi:hypothetical protein
MENGMAAPNAITHLAGWENFYVIVGSSAGALIGLQFVVMTLISEGRGKAISKGHKTSSRQISAFGTPTVIHFAASLLIAAAMSVPWESVAGLRATLGIFGIVGTAYAVTVIHHALSQKGYKPVLEDWIFYAALPIATYALLFVAAFLLASNLNNSLFMVAIVALSLLFIGIHNSWDTVTYMVIGGVHEEE